MEFNKLMELEPSEMTANEQRFNELHQQIIYYANTTADSMLYFSKNLSEMKNGESYKAAGFESFAEYAEKAVGLKERQAYNYASLYEKMGEEKLHSNAKIGVTKLLLLANVSEEKQAEIVSAVDVEKTSVSELKKLLQEKEKLINKAEQKSNDLIKTQADSQSEIDKLKSQLFSAKTQREKLAAELEQERMRTAKPETVEKIVEVQKTVEVKDTESIEKLAKLEIEMQQRQTEIERKTAEIEKLQKQLATSDELMTKFKVKFNDLQNVGIEMLNFIEQMADDQKAKCKKAITKVIEGWKL